MAEYIGKYENAAAIQSAVDNGDLLKPYVALVGNEIDWNSKSETDYSSIPLTFEILSDGNIVWKANKSQNTKTIQYKKNNDEWTNVVSTTAGVAISVVSGDTVQFRGDNSTYNGSSFQTTTPYINIYGNIMSLINSTGYTSLTTFLESSNFAGLFSGLNVINSNNLILPATILKTSSYNSMFKNCTSLVNAPVLPATTLESFCYTNMFQGCTSLTTAPELPATTLAGYCCHSMFAGCTNLNYIKCLATYISATDCTTNWLNGVASTGTFVKAAGVNWSTGVSGIPSGWTVIEE